MRLYYISLLLIPTVVGGCDLIEPDEPETTIYGFWDDVESSSDAYRWVTPTEVVSFNSRYGDDCFDRIGVQGSLPARVLNAWTQRDDLGVSRHVDFLGTACLACLYLPSGEAPHESLLVAEAVGLPEPEVRILLYSRTPVDQPILERIAEAMGIPVGPLLQFAGRPLQEFYSGAVCGGVLLRLGAHGGPSADVPLAFQSAMAGVMLAAEIVADSVGSRSVATTTRIDLLRPLASFLAFQEQKHFSGRCICQDEDFRSVYSVKYGA